MIIGIDEVGRGPLAGPVVAAAVGLKLGHTMPPGVVDSKKLSASKREHLGKIISNCCFVGLGRASVAEIDALNILQATFLAMQRAVQNLIDQYDGPIHSILVDGNQAPKWSWQTQTIVRGDQTIPLISAASIMAKNNRDPYMVQLHTDFPVYNFCHNKGYGTAAHLKALAAFGPCPHHRLSFKLI